MFLLVLLGEVRIRTPCGNMEEKKNLS